MSDTYRAGAVWLIRHDFYRGRGLQDKFIVLLCDIDADPNIETPSAFVTSQGRHYPRSDAAAMPACGCPKESCFRIDPPANHPCFDRRSFVEFKNLHQVTRAMLDGGSSTGDVAFRYRIQGQELSAILKCALQSDDIAGEDEDRVDAAYKAMAPKKKATTAPPPAPVPSFVAAHGSVALTAHFRRHCGPCQIEVAQLLDETTLRRVMAGSVVATDAFLADAEAAFQMLRDAQVTGCTCRPATPA